MDPATVKFVLKYPYAALPVMLGYNIAIVPKHLLEGRDLNQPVQFILSATRRNSAFDRVVAGLSFLGVSTPEFWLGIVLIVIFAVQLKTLPAGGMYKIGAAFSIGDRIQHLLMPVFVLAMANLAEITRYTRSAMIGALGEDYIRTAHAKGLSGRAVIFRHALRNALVPVITIIGVYLPRAAADAAQRGMLGAHLTRGQNRLVWALEQARETVRR